VTRFDRNWSELFNLEWFDRENKLRQKLFNSETIISCDYSDRLLTIYSDRSLQLDRPLKLKFFVDRNTKIESAAQVIWKRKIYSETPAKYEVGLELNDIPRDYFSVLSDWEERLLLTSDGRLTTIIKSAAISHEEN
jgi:hypothetical protein